MRVLSEDGRPHAAGAGKTAARAMIQDNVPVDVSHLTAARVARRILATRS
jgi:hypothetical protein